MPSPRPSRWSLRTSLPLRIFLAFAVLVTCTGAASFYGIAAVGALRHELGFLRQGALPLLDELRQSGLELRGFDEALQRAEPHDLEWVVRFTPTARPFQRVDQILAHTRALRDLSRPPRLGQFLSSQRLPLPVLDARLAALRSAHEARDRMVQDPVLRAAAPGVELTQTDAAAFDVLVDRLQRAIAEKRLTDAGRIVVEIRRIIRQVHGALGRAERDFEHVLSARFEEARRSESNLGVIVVTASLVSLAVAIVMLLAMLATLRPMTALTEVVRRFASGDRKARAATGGATEIATLALEWNRMADALAQREAQLGAQREELTRTERLATLGHMAARMVHEVRNPLSSIGLNAELLDEELSRGTAMDAEEARELLAAIGREIERLRHITEVYLDRARPAPTQQQRIDLGELVESVHEFVRSELERRGVVALVTVERGVWVEADSGLLRQALWNLLRNAWEAMPQGGRVWLEVSTRLTLGGRRAVIAVEDTGPGVPQAERDAIFEPFTTSKERGTGIGLALVREVAAAHGGRIQLTSGRHGPGARFELELPPVAPG